MKWNMKHATAMKYMKNVLIIDSFVVDRVHDFADQQDAQTTYLAVLG